MSLSIAWCKDPELVPELIAFFMRHVARSYISHGEVQDGRAVDFQTWSPDLEEVLSKEFREHVLSVEPASRLLAVARSQGDLIGMALVQIDRRPTVTYGTVVDLVVHAQSRGDGVGREMLGWIEERVKQAGASMVFLESGIGNDRAHQFFHREGYRTCSVVMVKEL